MGNWHSLRDGFRVDGPGLISADAWFVLGLPGKLSHVQSKRISNLPNEAKIYPNMLSHAGTICRMLAMKMALNCRLGASIAVRHLCGVAGMNSMDGGLGLAGKRHAAYQACMNVLARVRRESHGADRQLGKRH